MTVLLLHGLGNSAAHIREQLAPAIPEGRRVIAPDVRAHGDSPVIGSARDFSFEGLTEEITAQIDGDVGDSPLTVVGVSMGAALAVRLALGGHPTVERLVLIRPSFTDHALPGHLRAFPVMGELLMRHGAAAAERLFKGSSLYHSLTLVTQAGAAAALQQFRAPDASARAIRLVEIPRNRAFGSYDELAAITVPTTVVAAPRDPVHPVAVAEAWHGGIRGSSLVHLPARDDGMAAHLAALRSAVSAAFA
ncbi:alpha/beta hydrolase [Salinibacterium sp. SYSU T00001]|uniref:alpha/beta fold hydrolase n=1 Tax=Homoserinimonas sedimenticola TaxID=2986805 RepID=UPI0022366124|nr:alpha/beta hydrolase [Salinibacterium sedimenticola]MCW4385244.1 alpha/beta hydrolase [Salinibacterium sedimenticola]